MTAYDSLLAKVASGISLLLADQVLTAGNRDDFPNMVAAWTEQFAVLEKEMAATIEPAPQS